MTNEEIIFKTAIHDGIPERLAALMVAQAKVESANFKHKFFTIGKNAFGYSYDTRSAWQLDKGGPKADNGVSIAQYNSLENSTHEVTSWIHRRQREGKFPRNLEEIQTPLQYGTLLFNAHYGGRSAKEYSNAIATWFKENIKLVGGSGLILAALVFF